MIIEKLNENILRTDEHVGPVYTFDIYYNNGVTIPIRAEAIEQHDRIAKFFNVWNPVDTIYRLDTDLTHVSAIIRREI